MKNHFYAPIYSFLRKAHQLSPKFIVYFLIIPSITLPQFAWAASEVDPALPRSSMHSTGLDESHLPRGVMASTPADESGDEEEIASSGWCPRRVTAGWERFLGTIGWRRAQPLSAVSPPREKARSSEGGVALSTMRINPLTAAARAAEMESFADTGGGAADRKATPESSSERTSFAPVRGGVKRGNRHSTVSAVVSMTPEAKRLPGDLGFPNPMRTAGGDSPDSDASGASSQTLPNLVGAGKPEPRAGGIVNLGSALEDAWSDDESKEGAGTGLGKPHVAVAVGDGEDGKEGPVKVAAPNASILYIKEHHEELTALLKRAVVKGKTRTRYFTAADASRLKALLNGYVSIGEEENTIEAVYPDLLKALKAYQAYQAETRKKAGRVGAKEEEPHEKKAKALADDLELIEGRQALGQYIGHLLSTEVTPRDVTNALLTVALTAVCVASIPAEAELIRLKIIQGLATFFPTFFRWTQFDPIGLNFISNFKQGLFIFMGTTLPLFIFNTCYEFIDRFRPAPESTAVKRIGKGETSFASNMGLSFATLAKAALPAYMFFSRGFPFVGNKDFTLRFVSFLFIAGIVEYSVEFANMRTKITNFFYGRQNPAIKPLREKALHRLEKARKEVVDGKKVAELKLFDGEMRPLDKNQKVRKILGLDAAAESESSGGVKKPSLIRRMGPVIISTILAAGFAYVLGITFKDSLEDLWNTFIKGKPGQSVYEAYSRQYAEAYQEFILRDSADQFNKATASMPLLEWFRRCIASFVPDEVDANGQPEATYYDDDPTIPWVWGTYTGVPGCPGVIQYPSFKPNRFAHDMAVEFYYDLATPATTAMTTEAAQTLFDYMKDSYYDPLGFFGGGPNAIYRAYLRGTAPDLLQPNRTGIVISPAGQGFAITGASLATPLLTGVAIVAAAGMWSIWLDLCSRHPKGIIPQTRIRNMLKMGWSNMQGLVKASPIVVTGLVLMPNNLPDGAIWTLLATALVISSGPAVSTYYRSYTDGLRRLETAWRLRGEGWRVLKEEIAKTRLGRSMAGVDTVPVVGSVVRAIALVAGGAHTYVYQPTVQRTTQAVRWVGNTWVGTGMQAVAGWGKTAWQFVLGPGADPVQSRYDAAFKDLILKVPSRRDGAIKTMAGSVG